MSLALSLALGHVLLKILPVQYRASAELLLFDPTRAASESLAQVGNSAHALDPVAINTDVEVIRSAAALGQLARSLRLDRVPEFQNAGLRASLRLLLGVQPPPSPGNASTGTAVGAEIDAAALGRAVIALSKRISVEHVPLSYVVRVTATAGQPTLAYQLVMGLVQEYLGSQDEWAHQSLSRSAAWLRSKITETQRSLSDTNSQIERLRSQSGITFDGKSTLAGQERADLNTKLVAARAEMTDRKSRLELALTPSDGANPAVSDGITSPALTQLRLQLSLLERDKAQLSRRFGPQHAQVLAIEDQANTLRRAIDDETAQVVAGDRAAYALAQARERALVAELQHLGETQVDTGVLARLQELQRAADASSKLLDSYSARLQDVEAAQSLGASDKRILSPARVPSEPSAPRPLLIYAGAAVLGLMIGVALALLLGMLSRSIPPTGPAQRRFGQPILGNVPLFRGMQSWSAIAHSVGDGADSAMASALRSIRLGLELGSRGRGSKIIVVTSSTRREGRSTVAVALAAAMAQSGMPTLLVDGDVSLPSGLLPPGWQRSGLVDALDRGADLMSVIRAAPEIGCYVAAAARRRPDDSQAFLFSGRFRHIIDRLQERFAYVIIDAPPLMPVPDVCIITDRADAVLLVVDVGNTRADQVRQALSILRSAGRSSVGIVLNKQPLSQLRRAGLTTSGQRATGLARGDRPSWLLRRRRGERVAAVPAAERSSP